jgi:hypothetical protein
MRDLVYTIATPQTYCSSSAAAGYWSCAGCFMCGTVDEAQRALVVSSSSGSSRSSSGTNSSGMTPALLEQLARDAHFSLTTHLTELVHRLALISAQAEARGRHGARHSGRGLHPGADKYNEELLCTACCCCWQSGDASAGLQRAELLLVSWS